MVRLENIALSYEDGHEILSDLNLELPKGSFHFLLGASGSGKSTLLRLLYMALPQIRGRYFLNGNNVANLDREEISLLRRKIGVVFQDFRLINHLSTFANVALPLNVIDEKQKIIDDHVTELLQWVGLGDEINTYPQMLSGGQKQRVAIARAVINRPDIILADEPTGNVDKKMAKRLLFLFEEMNKLGTTVLIATHNEDLVKKTKHSIIKLQNGKAKYH
jgi:cell division transport system ATP-binding protein|tara:strand:+ start:3211 stop:3867 length:657 start_codon:yes stop_codon:yes gene_type:complete